MCMNVDAVGCLLRGRPRQWLASEELAPGGTLSLVRILCGGGMSPTLDAKAEGCKMRRRAGWSRWGCSVKGGSWVKAARNGREVSWASGDPCPPLGASVRGGA